MIASPVHDVDASAAGSFLLRRRLVLALSMAAFAAAGCAGGGMRADDTGEMRAQIRRTEFGVPHVLASNWRNLGYGVGFAHAQDRICDLAEVYVTARAERSLFWGADKGNLESDVYRQRLIDSGVTKALLADPTLALDADYKEMVAGFVAGYNKYVRETPPQQLPEACRGQPWVRPITELDYYMSRTAGRRGPLDHVSEIVGAAPPGAKLSSLDERQFAVRNTPAALDSPIDDAELALDGSNGWALGPSRTQAGSTMLLASPHWPWEGLNKPGFWPQRVMLTHMTIPGVFNHIGVSRMGSVVQQIGHSEDVARTHTVSAVPRDVVYQLKLDPADPTRYLYDGQPRQMQRYDVTVRVRQADGRIVAQTRSVYWTHFGPVIQSAARAWTRTTAYALRSVMTAREWLKVEEHKLALDRAKSTDEILATLSRYQVQDTNTIAIDRRGNTLFADVGNIPHLDNALLARCGTARQLDGSRSECELGTDADSARPGIFGPSRGAVVHRKAYVANSNNPPRYANPDHPLESLEDVFGKPGVALSLRARLGLQLIDERHGGRDGLGAREFTLDNIQTMFMGTRVHAAELVLDDLLAACRSTPSVDSGDGARVDLAPACAVLARWDRSYRVDSRGGHIFREFIREGGLKFADAVAPAQPLSTPRRLDTANPEVLRALARAVVRIGRAKVALDAPLGSIQTTSRGTERIAVPGGDSNDGVFNYMTISPLREGGYNALGATGLVYFVEFGPSIRSRGTLIYGTSSDPASPHYSDQMRAYGRGEIIDWRFLESDIQADPKLTTTTISGR
ncbi:penicillin acylase family protein (plasmid) [Variovorax sp. 375MFSha3.1]|uniref:penicillin acylase family protein n=1 Tax=unclassified Variovorax TaxID=663243 RepID=UPI003AAF34F1